MPKTCYSYIRFSSKRQEQGTSFARQAELSAKWCAANDGVLDTTLNMHDLGVSGYKGHNLDPTAALGGFLREIEQGRIAKGSYLLIESLDRLSRLHADAAYQVFRSILLADVNIVTLLDNKVYTRDSLNNFQDIIISILIMTRAHEESSTKAMRLADRWDKRRKNINNKKIDTRYPSWVTLSKDKTQFFLIDSAADAIRRIYKEYLEGNGVIKITKGLNADGIECPSSRSNHWRVTYVQRLLRDRALIGEYQPRKREGAKRVPVGLPIKDYFPAVVIQSDFDKVQGLLGKVPPKAGKADYGINIFAGKLFCPYCGERVELQYMQVSKRKANGERAVYGKDIRYSCKASRAGKCLNVSWRADDLKRQFLDCSTEIQAAFSDNTKPIAETLLDISSCESVISTKNRAINNLKKLIENSDDVPDDAMTHWRSLLADKEAAERKLVALKQTLHALQTSNPFDNIKEVDLSKPDKALEVKLAIHTMVDKIHLFFAGDNLNYQRALLLKRKLKNDKVSPTGIAYTIKTKLKIEERRFFVVHLNKPGLNNRIVYPKHAIVRGEYEDADEDVDNSAVA